VRPYTFAVTEEQDQRRAAKTIVRLQSGEAESTHPPGVCDGCGELIDPADEERRVNIRGVLERRFHGPCYEAWLNFRR